jgi:hypothetical protein
MLVMLNGDTTWNCTPLKRANVHWRLGERSVMALFKGQGTETEANTMVGLSKAAHFVRRSKVLGILG